MLLVALAAFACRKQDPPRVFDAAPPADAELPIDAAPPIDAAAKPAVTPTKLVAAGDSTCAVMSDLTVRCWGGNAHGQLGNGETTDAASPVTPAIRAVVDLRLVDATACALLDDASVACWGRIAWNGRGGDVLRPTGVLGVIGVKQIFVVPGRACARVANDSLVCWGDVNARGHFAAGAASRVPTPVVGLDHIADLTSDGAFSDDGRMWRWGKDGVPHRIDVNGVQEIAARDATVCGLVDGGRVLCVDDGRCGNAAGTKPPAQPAAPPSKPASAASTKPGTPGASTANAATGKPAAGKVATAGKSTAGKGTTGNAAAGASATSKPAASKLAASKSTAGKSTAAAAGAKAAAPGKSAVGAKAGDKAATGKPGTAVGAKAGDKAATGKPGTAVGTKAGDKTVTGKPGSAVGAKSGDKAATTKPAGDKAAAGKPGITELVGEPAYSPGFPAARQLAFDVGFCAVTTVGRLQCGDGCRKLDPIALERVEAMVGRCALLKSGTVTCFDGAKFVAVPGLQRATSLTVGRAHACALVGDTIRCWGDDAHHQLGDFAITL